jgi:hypothetical protein
MAAVSAVPPTLDLNLYAGDDVAFTLTVVDTAGNPYDLTGTMVAEIRKAHAQEVVGTLTVDSPTPTSGIAYLSLSAAETAALGEGGGRHAWDLQLTDELGLIASICRGQVSTTLDITQVGP